MSFDGILAECGRIRHQYEHELLETGGAPSVSSLRGRMKLEVQHRL